MCHYEGNETPACATCLVRFYTFCTDIPVFPALCFTGYKNPDSVLTCVFFYPVPVVCPAFREVVLRTF